MVGRIFSRVYARPSLLVHNSSYSRHLIRLRRWFETVRLKDAIPETVLRNSHDGTSAYHLQIIAKRLKKLAVARGCLHPQSTSA